jgi:hypothetical protein
MLYTTEGPHYYTTELEPPNSIVPASCLELEKHLRVVATHQLISLPTRREFKPLFKLAFSGAWTWYIIVHLALLHELLKESKIAVTERRVELLNIRLIVEMELQRRTNYEEASTFEDVLSYLWSTKVRGNVGTTRYF